MTEDLDPTNFFKVYTRALLVFNPKRLRIFIYRKSGSNRVVIEKRAVAGGINHTFFYEEESTERSIKFYESNDTENKKFRELMPEFDKVEVETDGVIKPPFGSYDEFIKYLRK